MLPEREVMHSPAPGCAAARSVARNVRSAAVRPSPSVDMHVAARSRLLYCAGAHVASLRIARWAPARNTEHDRPDTANLVLLRTGSSHGFPRPRAIVPTDSVLRILEATSTAIALGDSSARTSCSRTRADHHSSVVRPPTQRCALIDRVFGARGTAIRRSQSVPGDPLHGI